MALNDLQQKAIDYLNKYTDKTIPCEICGANKWGVQKRLFQLLEFNVNRGFGDTTIPVLCLECSECGNMRLVNAVIAGIIKEGDGEGWVVKHG